MAVITKIAPKKFAAWLQQQHGLGPIQGFTALEGGIQNTNYKFQLAGESFIFTVFEKLTASQVENYAKIVRNLHTARLPVAPPRVLRGMACWTKKPVQITPCLPGDHKKVVTVNACQKLGRALAKLHQAGTKFPKNIRGLWGLQERQSAWNRIKVSPKHLIPRGLLSQIEQLAALDCQFSRRAAPSGFCHRDFLPGNILWRGEELSGIIDFYNGGVDLYINDLAVSAWGFGWADGKICTEKITALLAGYHEIMPLGSAELKNFSTALRVTGFRYLVSDLFDQLFPRPGITPACREQKRIINRFMLIMEASEKMCAPAVLRL